MKKLGVLCRMEQLEEKERWFLNRTLTNVLLPLPIVLFPIVGCGKHDDIVSLCDGLLLPGGDDAWPCYHDGHVCAFSRYYDAPMDLWELALIDAFVRAQRPILGICRGMQMIQLYFKGELQPHFDVLHHQRDHVHRIHLSSRSWLHALMAPDAEVNSFHHQRIVTSQAQLRVDATAEDGTIESFHHEDLPVYGVQWHPELMHDDRILPYFVSLICGFV